MDTSLATLPTSGRRLFFGALLGAALAAAGLIGCGSPGPFNQHTPWYATWAVAPVDYNAVPTTTGVVPTALTFTNQTLRHTLQTSMGGEQLRVRFSNLFGKSPLLVAGAHVARSGGGSTIDMASDKAVTVGGQATFSVPAGSEAWSDPVAFSLAPNANLAVSVFVASATPAATYHALGRQTTYVGDGNQLAAVSMPSTGSRQSYYWVTGIDVQAPKDAHVLVAFGDSITDGTNSTVDTNRRYPNVLARRFAADATAKRVSVVNLGISGNRVLNDTAGPKGIDRFERDVLGQSGVTHTIVLLGINDLGYCGRVGPAHCVTADQVIAGLGSIVAKARARGVKVHLATLTPFKGTTFAGYYNDEAEAKRQAVNAWIRANKSGADGVIDFDLALQSPTDPLSLRPAWDSGDHLHPNDAGYEAMAAFIDLSKFR